MSEVGVLLVRGREASLGSELRGRASGVTERRKNCWGAKMPGLVRDLACEEFHTPAEMQQGVQRTKLVQRVEPDDSQDTPTHQLVKLLTISEPSALTSPSESSDNSSWVRRAVLDCM